MKIIITAGGTGGHLIPAQSLADKFLSQGYEVVFLGKNLGKNRNFQKKKYFFKEIQSSHLKNIFSPFLIVKGIFQTFFFFRKFKPDILIGFGSYYTFPPLICAVLKKIPIFLFEPNVKMGKVNRWMKKFSTVSAVQFFSDPKKKERLIDICFWRKSLKISKDSVKEKLGLQKDLFTILVFGGSQGSNLINDVFIESLEKIDIPFQVIHITGKVGEYERYYQKRKIPYVIKEYQEDMDPFFMSSDMAIARAGACTISEFIFYKIPSILIPLKNSSENHQIENAFFMEKISAAKIIFQKDLDKNILVKEIKKVFLKKEDMQKSLDFFCSNVKKEGRKSFEDLIRSFL